MWLSPTFTSVIALAAAVPAPAFAQDEAPSSTQAQQPATESTADGARHEHREEDIVVTGVRRPAGDVLGGVSVLDGADLDRELRSSIGETLASLPGVSATSFGPTASAPVLRGLSGDRVRVLTDGIGTLDLSSAGAEHAVSINPITAVRIEVLRGPAALLFGSSAIGGVVNVIDARIPRGRPDGPLAADAIAQYGTAADERSVNAGVDVPLGGNFVAHADGNWSKTDDLRTGGYILSKELREEAAASPDPEVRALASLEGELPNSASQSREGALGLGYVDGDLNVGVSITRHLQTYGVPIRYSLEPGVENEAPTIDVRQTRYDARAEIPMSGFFRQIRARGGFSEYRLAEIEDTGEVASRLFSNGGEGRLELVQRDRLGWGGTSGFQYLDRDVRIRGEEKFLPDTRQRQAGLLTLQTYVRGPFRLEGGARVELSKLSAEEDEQIGTPAHTLDFTTVSGSLGGQYEFSPGWRAGLSISHSERAPAVTELFARGPHHASQSFELGNPDLKAERSNSVELTLHRTAGPVKLSANAYYSRFSNFIFQAPTGEIEEDLPVFEFRQGMARYYGFESHADARLGRALGIDWGAELQADAVRAMVKNFGPAPLIPPFRLVSALTGERGQVDGRLEVERAFAHNRTAPLETDTPGYTLVNAAVDWHPRADTPELTLGIEAHNIFDVVARRSTSLLKDYAPLPGRDIRLSARLRF